MYDTSKIQALGYMSTIAMNATTSISINDTSLIKTSTIRIITPTMELSTNAILDMNERGYSEGQGTDVGKAKTDVSFTGCYYYYALRYSGAGGAYGGDAGKSCDKGSCVSKQPEGGSSYGSATWPVDYGSGGGKVYYDQTATSNRGGAGGGRIHITLTNHMLLNGVITANGGDGKMHDGYYDSDSSGGGGAGGSILIEADSLSGNGIIRANGGGVWNNKGGSGGGGRIAIHLYQNVTLQHKSFENMPTLSITTQAFGGSHGTSCGGAAGTIFHRHGVWTILHIDNNDHTGSNDKWTPLPLELTDASSSIERPYEGSIVWTVIEKNARVEMRGAVGSGTFYHSFYLTLSSSSKIKGNQIHLYSHDMNIAGDITGTSKIVVNSAVVAWPQDNKEASDHTDQRGCGSDETGGDRS